MVMQSIRMLCMTIVLYTPPPPPEWSGVYIELSSFLPLFAIGYLCIDFTNPNDGKICTAAQISCLISLLQLVLQVRRYRIAF